MANELAMTLELGGFGDAAFRNVSASIKVSRSLSKDLPGCYVHFALKWTILQLQRHDAWCL